MLVGNCATALSLMIGAQRPDLTAPSISPSFRALAMSVENHDPRAMAASQRWMLNFVSPK
jgi:hypothetical protein